MLTEDDLRDFVGEIRSLRAENGALRDALESERMAADDLMLRVQLLEAKQQDERAGWEQTVNDLTNDLNAQKVKNEALRGETRTWRVVMALVVVGAGIAVSQ